VAAKKSHGEAVQSRLEAKGIKGPKGAQGNKGAKGQHFSLPVWGQLGVHCSANERRADEASRDVEAWLKCYYMRDHLGQEYAGTITGVANFGLFIQLENLFVEGMVHVTELGGDYFQYDEARQELRGERTGIRHRLGDRLHVLVSRVDLDARKIEFSLVKSIGAEGGGSRTRNVILGADSGRPNKKAASKKTRPDSKAPVKGVQSNATSGATTSINGQPSAKKSGKHKAKARGAHKQAGNKPPVRKGKRK
jgi:ribonuclease R